MMEFRFCVRESERATKRDRSYSQRKKGERNIRAYVQKLRLLLEMKRKYRMQVPCRRRRRSRSSNPIFLPRGRVHPLLQVNQAFFILSLSYIIIHHHNHHHHHHLSSSSSSSSSQAFCCSALNMCVVHCIW